MGLTGFGIDIAGITVIHGFNLTFEYLGSNSLGSYGTVSGLFKNGTTLDSTVLIRPGGKLKLTVAPEPASMIALAGGLALLVKRRRVTNK